VTIVGASFDTPAENKAFTDEHGFGFPLLCDVDHAVGRVYGVERGADENNPQYPKRMTFVIDPEGKVAKVYEVADAGAHPDEVLSDLAAILAS
jgi:thioredoxin-dependent peroxiredoxin